jgi:ATP-dependent DNA helicase RecQ
VAYAETSMSRRRFLLHYFGEEFDEVTGDGADMDDNVRNPKNKSRNDQVVKLLEVVRIPNIYTNQKKLFFYAIDVNAVIKAHRTDTQSFFGLSLM